MPGIRTRNIFDPTSTEPYKLSRSRLEVFIKCPRCFYLDRRLGVDRVPGFPFTLNTATDVLLKKEFDKHRKDGTPHPVMEQYGIDAVPFQHPQIDEWRENFKGVQYHHPETNFIVTGAVDDVWVRPSGQLIVVDYKSTSTQKEITLNDDWKAGYKRQMEIYQWLLRRNGFDVSDTGYFLFVNADKDRPGFDARLEFAVQLLAYKGDDRWVVQAILDAHACLVGDHIPTADEDCEWCAYRRAAKTVGE